jgi:hypothetical protein
MTDNHDRGHAAGVGYRKYNGSDLITSVNHEKIVEARLEDLGVTVAAEERSADLGLTRLTLADVGTAARKVVEAAEAARLPVGFPPRPSSSEDTEDRPLDDVLWGLRALFAARWSRWSPTLGKNRILGSVTGVGEISHGGGGDPRPDRRQRPAARQAGPGAGVRVGVLDAALSPVPWLTDGWEATWPNRILPGTVPGYADAHATFVTGLVLSQAPSAKVEVSRVLRDGAGDSWTLAREIVRMGNSGVDVLNLSLVCYTDDGEPPMALAAAVDRLDPAVVVVAAAGNHGSLESKEEKVRASWPAALDDVVAVGSTANRPEGEAELADFTPDAPWVDLLAAGEDLLSTFPDKAKDAKGNEVHFGDWARWNGTSFSAALVSGALAASVVPGRVTARQALDGLLRAARANGPGPFGSTGAPYLPLNLL